MPREKTRDPKLLALLDRQEKLRRDFVRNYARMRRAFSRVKIDRRTLARLRKRIDEMNQLDERLGLLNAQSAS
jgi:hypothetical protein